MGKAKKRGTGAWGGDTSSDDDEDEEEEDDSEEEDQDERDGPLTACPGSASNPRRSMPSIKRRLAALDLASCPRMARGAANAGLEAPAPGRFSSYDGGFSSGGSGRRDPSLGGMGTGTGTPTAGGSGSGGWGDCGGQEEDTIRMSQIAADPQSEAR
ncbi:hypothetical protein V8E36_008794 [Tilletia maclaganii]